MFAYIVSATLLGSIAAQPIATEVPENAQTEEVQRVAGYRADIRELRDRIKAEHPRPFRTLTEAEFDTLVQAELDALEQTSTRADFLWAMSKVIAAIGCGHSKLPYFNQQDAEISIEQRFPINVRFHAGRLYVVDAKNNGQSLSKGDEIVRINGTPVARLREEIFARMASDVHLPNSKEAMSNFYSTSYLTYALGFPEQYAVTLRGQAQSILLDPMTEWEPDPILRPNDVCREELCYEKDEARNIGIATLRSLAFYGGERGDYFQQWWAGVMGDLQTNRRGGLLIDMRGVLGGSGTAGSYMLRHLTSEPFAFYAENSDPRGREGLFLEQQPIGKGFDGQVYILMDGLTLSAVPHFLALAQANDIATLVGAPAGGGKSTNDGKRRFTSTHESVEYSIARMIFEVQAPQLTAVEAVQPDIALSYSLVDTLDRSDSMRERAIELLGLAVERSNSPTRAER
ncbi:MAG: S41 family peptidase [Pseudomonadota bacterium]